jgi:hypothetical protein
MGLRLQGATIMAGAEARPVAAYGVSGDFFRLSGLPMALAAALRRPTPCGVRRRLSCFRMRCGRAHTRAGRHHRLCHHVHASAALYVGVAPAEFACRRDGSVGQLLHPRNIGHGYDGYLRLKPERASRRCNRR